VANIVTSYPVVVQVQQSELILLERSDLWKNREPSWAFRILQLVKKCLTLQGVRNFITVLTRACLCLLCCARIIQFTLYLYHITDKRQTRPLVREGAPQRQDSNFQTELISGHKSQVTDWPTISRNVTSASAISYF
jgi:hypothetical protein